MKTKLTLRERIFIDAYIENNGNATKAYLTMNPEYEGKQARKLGYQIWTKIDISINEIAEEMGLTDPIIVQKIIDGLSATKESGTAFQKKEITDYAAIVKYIDIALKLKGKYPSEKHDINVGGEVTIKVELPKEENADDS